MKTSVKNKIKNILIAYDLAINTGDDRLISEAKELLLKAQKKWPLNFPRVEKSYNAKKLSKNKQVTRKTSHRFSTRTIASQVYDSNKPHSLNGD